MPGRPSVIQLHRTMVIIRRFEERCEALYAAGEIYGSLHLSVGQEGPRDGPGQCPEDRPRPHRARGGPDRGFGAELAALVAEHAFYDLDAPVRRVTGLDVPLPYSRPLETAALPSVASIAAALRAARA